MVFSRLAQCRKRRRGVVVWITGRYSAGASLTEGPAGFAGLSETMSSASNSHELAVRLTPTHRSTPENRDDHRRCRYPISKGDEEEAADLPDFLSEDRAAVSHVYCSDHCRNHREICGRIQSGLQSTGWTFLWIFALNIVVLAFDFPRTMSLTLFFLVMAAVLGVILASTYDPKLLPMVNDVISKINPHANATFYFLFATIIGLIYCFVFTISIRFDYWEVRPNELLHHHGFLSSLERFSTPNLRITKEIDDIFEYLLLGSGRLGAATQQRAPCVRARQRALHHVEGGPHHENAGLRLQVQLRDERPGSAVLRTDE